MKRKRHTEEQIIAILKEHEAGVKTADLCRKHGGPLRCAPLTAPLRGPPSPPNWATPNPRLQSPPDKSWGQCQGAR